MSEANGIIDVGRLQDILEPDAQYSYDYVNSQMKYYDEDRLK